MMTGRVLWFDERDGHGIIVGSDGRKYYTDTSATPDRQPLKSGQTVTFRENESITTALCAIVY